MSRSSIIIKPLFTPFLVILSSLFIILPTLFICILAPFLTILISPLLSLILSPFLKPSLLTALIPILFPSLLFAPLAISTEPLSAFAIFLTPLLAVRTVPVAFLLFFAFICVEMLAR